MKDATLLSYRVAVKSGLASANILTATTALQVMLYISQVGVSRIRLKMPQWRKVA